MSEPRYVAETLAWCNRIRKENGRRPLKRLPRGHRMDPASCPCGKATGYRVTFEEHAAGLHFYAVRPYGNECDPADRIKYPRAVQRFVLAFDSGRLPQYEASA